MSTTTKLDWRYDQRSGEYRAEYKGLVIRAVHDDIYGDNPFEDEDCHWPMLVHYGGSLSGHPTHYDKVAGPMLHEPLARFNDELLVFMQHHIAKLMGGSVREFLECYDEDIEDPTPHCTDVEVLRSALTQAFEDWRGLGGTMLDHLAGMYELLQIPHLRHSSRGYSQGDWSEVLIVATPEAVEKFGNMRWHSFEEAKAALAEDMASQTKLYDAWAWGDVYGYVVSRPETLPDEFDDDQELVDLDSCWGFYGSDFEWSGLEDAAIESAEGHVREECHA